MSLETTRIGTMLRRALLTVERTSLETAQSEVHAMRIHISAGTIRARRMLKQTCIQIASLVYQTAMMVTMKGHRRHLEHFYFHHTPFTFTSLQE